MVGEPGPTAHAAKAEELKYFEHELCSEDKTLLMILDLSLQLPAFRVRSLSSINLAGHSMRQREYYARQLQQDDLAIYVRVADALKVTPKMVGKVAQGKRKSKRVWKALWRELIRVRNGG